MQYRPRVVDQVLDELFPALPAIALEGAKGVGKTATAARRAASTLSLNDPHQRTALAADHELVTRLPRPVFVDEWQLEPPVWDRVRRSVDDGVGGGSYLLAGSAGLAPGIRVHSGAGRIVSLPMRPMAFSERGVATPTVSLRELMSGAHPHIAGTCDVDVPQYTDEILRSGFPGIRDLPERARNVQLDSYIARILDRELLEAGVAVRRPAALRSWLTAYAAATATDAAYSTILDAATPGESDKPSRQTAAHYRDQLLRLFVLDPVEAWLPAFSPLKRLTLGPKHHLVDPALAARLVGVGRDGLLRGQGERVVATGTWLGALFESLVTQSLRVYAWAGEARVSHVRTKNTDHEIDLIVECPDRRVIAVEVKLARAVSDADVRHLNWLQSQIGDQVIERVVINTGSHAYRRPDGVAVIPLGLLGP